MRFLLTYILISFSFYLFSQSIKKADNAYQKGDFYKSVQLYTDVFEKTPISEMDESKRCEYYYKYASSLEAVLDFNEALKYYELLLEANCNGDYEHVPFHKAMCLKQLGKYELAKAEFQNVLKMLKENEKNDRYIKISKNEVIYCDSAKNMILDQNNSFNINKLGDNVNSKYADFAPHVIGNFLYFSRMRFESMAERRRNDGNPQKKHLYSKIMSSEVRGLAGSVQIGRPNKAYKNVGNSAISSDGKRLYFAIGKKSRKANWNIIAKLYVSEYNTLRNRWKRPKKLPFNNKIGSTTQPHISYDSTKNAEVIYFSSTRPGGFGGSDIWRVYHYGQKKYSEAENLGSTVNSEGNEITPHFHAESQTLYFSSDWHLNLGGYDVLSSKEIDGNWSSPSNMGAPLNSAANDIYYYITPEKSSDGFLTSNRVGSNILVGKSCCNDIYSFSIVEEDEQKDKEITDIVNAENNDAGFSTDDILENDLLTDPKYKIVPEKYNSPENSYSLPEKIPNDPLSGMAYPEDSEEFKYYELANELAKNAKDRELYWKDGELSIKEKIDTELYKIQIAAYKNLNKSLFNKIGQGKFSDLIVIYEPIDNGITRVLVVPKLVNKDGSYGFKSSEEAMQKLILISETKEFLNPFIWEYRNNIRLDDGIFLNAPDNK